MAEIPPSASLDETSIGYNAYSILKTGADEYGVKFPVLLRAFDDWRPALYVYLVVPFVKIFGLTVEAVRLPSVILSVLTIAATYFLTKEFIRRYTLIKTPIHADYIALISAGLLAISPWHVYISRLGHESNAGLVFFVFGLLFFFLALRKKQRLPFLLVSFLSLAFSFYSYQSEKIIIPIFVLVLFFIFRKVLLQSKREVLLAGCTSIIVFLPILQTLLSPEAFTRFKGTTAFYENNPVYAEQAKMFVSAKKEGNLMGQIFHHKKMVSVQIFVGSYLSHFNPFWLFGNKANDPHKIPGLGLMYIWEAPLLLLGILMLLKRKGAKNLNIILISWILISPLPAAITTDAPHAMRIYTLLPAPPIIAALGLVYLFTHIPAGFLRRVAIGAFSLVVFWSISFMYKQYFEVFPMEQSESFYTALARTMPYVLDHEDAYKQVVFSNKTNLHQSYIFFLFYSEFDPVLYQKLGGTVSGGYDKTHEIGKFSFRPIDWDKEQKENTLYVGNQIDFPNSVTPEFRGEYNDGTIGIILVDPARYGNDRIHIL